MDQLQKNKIKEEYNKEGIVFPLPVLTPDEINFYRGKIHEFLEKVDWKLDAFNRHKPHMYLKWANDLGRHPKILEGVRELLGENVLMWYSVVFVKPPNSKGRVPWHQDYTYWAMNEPKGLTAWVALSDVTVENGCVRYVPGSHNKFDYKHEIDNSKENMLARGQRIKDIDDKQGRDILLKAGEMSLHDLRLLHASEANSSNEARLGIAFRYIPTSNFPVTLKWMKRTATLVSGVDNEKNFTYDPVPKMDYDEEALKVYRQSLRIAAVHTLFGDDSRSNLRKVIDTIPILISRKTADYFKYWKNLVD